MTPALAIFLFLWSLPLFGFVALFAHYFLTDRPSVPPARRWAPDPAFDPENDEALIEDEEVATLDALWELPTREPLR